MRRLRYPAEVLWLATRRWIDVGGPQFGASIAFYTMFAIAPWLVLMIALGGLFFGADAARGEIVAEIGGLVGPDAARAIQAMIESAWRSPERGSVAAILGTLTLLVGASGVFADLRRALNAIAGVAPGSGTADAVGAFVRVRLIAFALLLAFGFLALASLLLSAAIAALGKYAQAHWPTLAVLATALDLAVTVGLLALSFASLLRWLPDRPPRPRPLLISSLVAAVLFSIGKHWIGLYLGRAAFTSSYGAAGSFVVVMSWVYYTSHIMLFGAACGYADEVLSARGRERGEAQRKET
jgi:membrane protein